MWKNSIHQSIYRLINYPADFQALLPTMIETIRMGVTTFGDDFSRVVVDAVYQTCMFDVNFCLIGSKLCNVISNSVQKGANQLGYRTLLLHELQKDFEGRGLLVKSGKAEDRKVI
jgi:hypothetical protein